MWIWPLFFFRLPRCNHARYLFSGQQGDGRETVGVFVAFRYGQLFEEIQLLLTGKKDDFGVAEHHDGVRQFVAKQPGLMRGKKRLNN